MLRADPRRSAGWMEVMRATFLRDMWTALSYRVAFLMSLASSFVTIFGVFFLSEAFGGGLSAPIEQYGGSYFAFAVIGVAFTSLMALGLTGVSARVREGQVMGTLELMLLSPNRLGLLLLSSSLWAHTQALATVVVYLVAGILLGMDVGQANVPMVILSFVLSIIAFNALGLFAASIVIVIKQGNPVSVLLGAASVLLGGVFYPVSGLPGWLQGLAQLLPITHALELVRRSMLEGEGIATLWGPALALTVLTAVLLPAGLWACHLAVRIAQTDGSLSQY